MTFCDFCAFCAFLWPSLFMLGHTINFTLAFFRGFIEVERISLSAFFPAYNDEHTIEGIVRTAAEEMRKVTDDFEVVVVDDGSKDKTGAILDRLATELPYLRVIHHETNLGYGAALISGFTNSKKDLIFYTDGDGQYDVREMHNLLAHLGPNIDL